jgi:hypothetical protein
MKTLLLLGVGVSLLTAGCGNDSSKPVPADNANTNTNTNANSGSVATAPVDYLNSITKAEHSAVKTIDVSTVNAAIRQFQVEQGRYPKDLDELVQNKYIPRIPPVPYGYKLDYDAETGEAKVVKQ